VASGGFSDFTIDAVVRRAGVARMTVYYQFGSKVELLETLCDSLAILGGMEQLAAAFQRPEPLDALAEFIATFGRFWDSGFEIFDTLASTTRSFEEVAPLVHRIARAVLGPGDR
jgi:AcrR family transcriptional regulator